MSSPTAAAFLFASARDVNPRSPKKIRGAARLQGLHGKDGAHIKMCAKAGPLRARAGCGGPNPRDFARVSGGCIGNSPTRFAA